MGALATLALEGLGTAAAGALAAVAEQGVAGEQLCLPCAFRAGGVAGALTVLTLGVGRVPAVQRFAGRLGTWLGETRLGQWAKALPGRLFGAVRRSGKGTSQALPKPALSPKARELLRAGKPQEALDVHYEDLIRARTGGQSQMIGAREVDAVTDDAIIQAKRSYSAIEKPKNFLNKKTRDQIKFTIGQANQDGKRAEFWFKYGVHPQVRAYIEGKGGVVRTGLGGP